MTRREAALAGRGRAWPALALLALMGLEFLAQASAQPVPSGLPPGVDLATLPPGALAAWAAQR